MDNPMDIPAAKAAAAVFREIPEIDKDGKPTGKMVKKPVEADEVLACRLRDEALTVITTDGQKLTGVYVAKKGTEKVAPGGA